MRRRLLYLKIVGLALWGVLLACSGRISPDEPEDQGFTVVNSSPANNATNVNAGSPITISVTFSAAVDTSIVGFLMAPVPTSFTEGFTLSNEGKTAIVAAILEPNTAYTAVIYTAKDLSGNGLAAPFQLSFTTGSTFPAGKVQGLCPTRVGGVAISPKGTLVALLKIDLPQVVTRIIGGQDPLEVLGENLAALAVVTDESGAYSINNVIAETYWPAAIKDVDGNASLSPALLGGADALGFYNNPAVSNTTVGVEDSVHVNAGQTVTGIDFQFP